MAYIDASTFVLTLPGMTNATITGSSVPLTIGEVATICEQISAEVDGAAAAGGYAIPVATGASEAYSQLQLITYRGAAWMVLDTLYPSMRPGDVNTTAKDYRDAYMAALALLRAGDLVLIGAPPASEGAGRELPRSYSTSNPTATSGVVPLIGMDFTP